MGDRPLTYSRFKPKTRGSSGLSPPFPDVYECRLRGSSAGPQTINLATDTPTNYIRLNLNWPWDPNFELAGWTARGYAEIAKIYMLGMVKRTWVRAVYHCDGLTQQAGVFCFMLPSNEDGSVPGKTVGYDLLRDTYTRAKVKQWQPARPMGGGTVTVQTMSYTWRPEVYWPARTPIEDVSNWWVVPGTTPPQRRQILAVGVTRDIGTYSTTASLGISVHWDIYYDCIFVRLQDTFRVGDAAKFISFEDALATEGWGEADDDGTPDGDVRTNIPTGDSSVFPAGWGTENP